MKVIKLINTNYIEELWGFQVSGCEIMEKNQILR